MRLSKPTIIGSKTTLDFPRQRIKGVPAKIDTGAYSSSVWASDIKAVDGVLSFRLFDRQSPHFTGQVIKTKDYEMRLVKNSFGQSEFRYRVPLSIQIEGSKLLGRFTLADRSNNRFPILVGRRTLQGRFIVDVTKHVSIKKSLGVPRVLVLVNSGGPKIRSYYQQINRDQSHRIQADLHKYSEITMRIEEGSLRLRLGLDGKDLSEYDLIYFKTFIKNLELAALVAAYAKQHNVLFVDAAASLAPANNKLHQYGLLSMNGVNVPDSWYLPPEMLKTSYTAVKDFLQVPFILKSIEGKKGKHNYFVKNKADFTIACAQAEEAGVKLIAQKYLENDGDYRAVVMGRRIALMIHRQGDKTTTHLNNTSTGGEAKHIPITQFPRDVQELCVNAARFLQWQVAGVDVLQDKSSNQWYCLEVNNSPQLVSGAFVEKKQAALVDFLLEETEQ